MKSIEFCEIVRNKLSQILQKFPVDGRRSDGMANPRNVRAVQNLVNLILTRIQRDYKDYWRSPGTKEISFCLQSDEHHKGGWQGVLTRKYGDCNLSINALRTALKLIEDMGGVVWRSQGRHKEGLLYCDVETLLLIDQACMVALSPDLEPVPGELQGDEQLSPEYWEEARKPCSPLRSTLKWVGVIAKRVFKQLPRYHELAVDVCSEAIALWNEAHRIVVPVIEDWKIETEIGFAWVDDYWLDAGDPCQ